MYRTNQTGAPPDDPYTRFDNSSKEVLGFRRFMRRGLEACSNEWKLMCMAHNLLKLWRYGIDKVHKTADALVMVEERERAMAFTA